MADVVLFQPALGYWEHFIRYIPLGLLAISRNLHPDLRVTVVDGRLAGWRERLAAELAARPLCLGVTVKTGRPITGALEASRIARELGDTPVVWGGVHPSLMPEQTIAHPLVDVVVAGEGEETFRDLVRALGGGSDLASIPGLWLSRNGGAVFTGARKPLSLNTIRPLPYEIIRFEDYAGHSGIGAHSASILETGRGCPNRCLYCYSPRFRGSRWRPLKSDRILDGIERLGRFTPLHTLFFIDDSFFTHPRRVAEVAEGLIQRRIPVEWGCEGSASDLARMSDGNLDLLRRSGCGLVALGVESGSAEVRARYGKRVDEADLLGVNRRLARLGIRSHFYFLMGWLDETPRDLRMTTDLTLRLLNDNRAATIQAYHAAVPYPGTRFLEMAREAGHPLPKSLEEWAECNPEDWTRRIPWLSARRRRLLRTLFLASTFLDGKVEDRAGTDLRARALRAAARLYRPIARLRVRHHLAILPVEVWLFDRFVNRRYRGNRS